MKKSNKIPISEIDFKVIIAELKKPTKNRAIVGFSVFKKCEKEILKLAAVINKSSGGVLIELN